MNKTGYSLIRGLGLFFAGIFFFSCTSLRNIGIQVAQLPEYPLSEQVQSLALLNRSMTPQFSNLSSDSLEKILFNQQLDLSAVIQDSLVTDSLLKVAANVLFESGRYDVVIPKDFRVERNDSNLIAEPLSNEYIKEICDDFHVDGALVLESFVEQIKTNYRTIRNFDPANSAYDATTDLTYHSQWRLYRPNGSLKTILFQIRDSIFWQASDFSLENLYLQMPKTKDALIDGGVACAIKMTGYISPVWINQNRTYYLTGKKEIDAAVPMILDNRWDEATIIWLKYANINATSVRAKVEYNLALASEIKGDFNLAIDWAMKSFKSKYTRAAELYVKLLNERHKEIELKKNKKSY